MSPTTTPRCSGAPSSSHHPPPPPPPPLRSGATPSSASSSHNSPPPAADRFDFTRDACGRSSPFQDALLRGSPLVGQEKEKPAALPADARGFTAHILHGVFRSGSPHSPNRRRRYSDAEAAELALTDYFLGLGPRRLHLLRPREGEQPGRTLFPSGTPEAAKEGPEGMPPPAEAPPSCLLEAAAASLATSSKAGKKKAAGLKRGRPKSSHPSRSPSSTAKERSTESKKPYGDPNGANPTAGSCSSDAGVVSTGDVLAGGGMPPSADHGGRASRKLPPSILCPVNCEEGGIGDDRGTRLRHRRPPLQGKQEAAGKAPAAGVTAAHAPSASSPVDRSLPAKSTEAPSSADVAQYQGGTGGPPYPSLTALVEEASPSRVCSEAISPSTVDKDAISLSTFVDVLLRFSKRPTQTPEGVDPLEAFAAKGIPLPAPKWWRPGGYGRPPTPPDK